jgi:brefeldin A-inhibited guanine nucleotide-exchange protein
LYFKYLEPIVILAFDITKSMFANNFELFVTNGSFPDFISCLVEFCKNEKYAKTSLQSIELMRLSIESVQNLVKKPKAISVGVSKGSENLTEMMHQGLMSIQTVHGANTPTQFFKPLEDDPNIRLWFPVFFGLVCYLYMTLV